MCLAIAWALKIDWSIWIQKSLFSCLRREEKNVNCSRKVLYERKQLKALRAVYRMYIWCVAKLFLYFYICVCETFYSNMFYSKCNSILPSFFYLSVRLDFYSRYEWGIGSNFFCRHGQFNLFCNFLYKLLHLYPDGILIP